MTWFLSQFDTNRRLLLALLLVAGVTALAGCSLNDGFSTSVADSANGTVIENLSITDINDHDGVKYELEYSLPARSNASFAIEVHERTDDSYERVGVTTVDPGETAHRDSVAPPWDAGEKRTYRVRVVDRSNGTTLDSVTMTIERTAS